MVEMHDTSVRDAAGVGLGDARDRFRYSVLIRTYNSEGVLAETLQALQAQTLKPSEYVFVDSGSVDGTLALCPAESKIVQYVGERFNYAEAINQGLPHVTSPYLLILSSHTVIGNLRAMETVLTLLERRADIGAAYMWASDGGELSYSIIDREVFDGFNGVWNTCSVIRMDLLRKRKFRPEVFSAEDQEWTNWLISEEGKVVARFTNAYLKNSNPRRHSSRKRLNELVAIAYFVRRDLLGGRHLLKVARDIVWPRRWFSIKVRVFSFRLLVGLVACRWRPPRGQSRYF